MRFPPGKALAGAAAVCAALIVVGCSSDAGDAAAPAVPPAVEVVTRVDSGATLETYLKAGIRLQSQPARWGGPIFVGVAATGMLDTSGTNLQESGVDEADRIKSDGSLLYVLSQPYSDMCCMSISGSTSSSTSTSTSLRIMRLSNEAAPAAVEISRLALAPGTGGNGLYLFSSAGASLDRIAIVGEAQPVQPYWFVPWGWQGGNIDVSFVDVSDPASPVPAARLQFDGHLVSSRRIGDTLYLASRFMPAVPGYQMYPASQEMVRQNEAVLQAAPLSALLPKWRVDGNDRGDLFAAEDCYLLPVAQDSYTADLVTLTAIDLRNPLANPKSVCLLGPTETLYASIDAVYLATTRYSYERSGLMIAAYPAEVSTDIHKIALTPSGPVLRASTAVPGHLGWHEDKKAFRLGEHQGVLRVVTSQGNWGDEQALLTMLQEQNGALLEIARLPNAQRPARIGKPGEQVYAVRFLGSRGYVVTFRVVDPLYVLDLSNPADPLIAGELQIAGYSDYLHPISDTHLLGIGKDAIPAEGGDAGRGAWYQGVKISLFDVSDPAAPKEIQSRVIGKRGTEAGVLYDHHALAWLPGDPATGRPGRLALPVNLNDTAGYFTSTEPWSWYDWTHRALYLFDIDPAANADAIAPRGSMVVADRSTTSSWGNWVASDRALLAGEAVHYVYGDRVWSAPWGNAAAMTGPQ